MVKIGQKMVNVVFGCPLSVLTVVEFHSILSKAVTARGPVGEQTKMINFEFTPLAFSTMYANTVRPGILVVSAFLWL